MGPSTGSLRLCLQWGLCALLLLAPTLVSMTSAALPDMDQPGSLSVATDTLSSGADSLPGAGRAVTLGSGVPEKTESGAESARVGATGFRKQAAGSHESSRELTGGTPEDNFATVGGSKSAGTPGNTPLKDNFAAAGTTAATSQGGPSFQEDGSGAARALHVLAEARELLEEESIEVAELVESSEPTITEGDESSSDTESSRDTDSSTEDGNTDSSVTDPRIIRSSGGDDADTSSTGAVSSDDGPGDDSDEVLASAVAGEWGAEAAREALAPRKLRPFWPTQGSTALPVRSSEDLEGRKGEHSQWLQSVQRRAKASLRSVLRLPSAAVSQERGRGEDSRGKTRGAELEELEETLKSFFSMNKGVGGASSVAGVRTAGAVTETPSNMFLKGSQLTKSWGVYMEEVSS